MATKDIKKEKNKLIKNSILKSAKEIVQESGLDNLSIRKLAKKVGYSPANIYQYFDNKDAIINSLIKQEYQKILKSLKNEPKKFTTVESEIRFKFRKYIEEALKSSDYYRYVMLNSSPNILSKTAILNSNYRKKRDTLDLLQKLIETGQKNGEFKLENTEKTAQIIWTATFGLIIRMIVEKINDKKEQKELINSHFEILFAGIRKEN